MKKSHASLFRHDFETFAAVKQANKRGDFRDKIRLIKVIKNPFVLCCVLVKLAFFAK